jgi:hypothetical protein
MSKDGSTKLENTPKAKFFREKIGNKEYELREESLDVFDDIRLWDENPRLIPHLAIFGGGSHSDEELENQLKRTNGYAPLAKSIADIGQMEPIYVWRKEDSKKYLVLEGATRATIKRELARKDKGTPREGEHRRIKAKILPAEFSNEERVILLAKIHVRGTGVRSWGRYIEAKFIHDTVVGADGQKAMMSVSELAGHMGKSVSWVSRLKDAYQFAQKFIDHVDSPDAQKLAVEYFSTLEEISKSAGVGPKVKDYTNPDHDVLRGEVFDMVRNGVFKEYRDARFMRQYYDDPEKWSVLKSGEENAANKLANDIRAGSTSLKAKIEALPGQIERAFERDGEAVNDDDVETLRTAVTTAESFVNPGVDKFRLKLSAFTNALEGASLNEIKAVQPDDMKRFKEALDDFESRLEKHKTWG